MGDSATQLQVDLNKVLRQLKTLNAVAQKNKWIFRVNDLDQAIFAGEYVPRGSYLWSFDDEKYLYLDADSNVNGFFIEYFSTNFLEHETKYKPILNELSRARGGTKVLKTNTVQTEQLFSDLEKEILVDFNEFKRNVSNEAMFQVTL